MKWCSKTVLYALVLMMSNAALALDGPTALHPWRSFFLYAVAFTALYLYCFHGGKTESRGIRGICFIVASGIILRLLFLDYPLSDDVNRYAWEGMIQQQGVNPYITAPAQMGEAFADDAIFAGINHKEVSTIYPPLAMLTFRVLSAFHYSLTTYKLFFIGCDLLLLALLVPLIRQWQRPAHWLAFYAWNPLVLLYGAGEGHLDVLYLLFMAAAFLAFTHRRSAATGFFLLGMAVMTKYLCVIFLPFLITRENRKWLPFFFLPFLAVVLFLAPGMTEGLAVFSGGMAYNDVIPRLLRTLFSGPAAYVVSMLAVFVFGYALIWLFTQDQRWTGLFYVYLWCILCLPCVHVWYLMPLALLMIWTPNRAVFLLMITVGLGFHIMHRQWYFGVWQESWWIWCATYIPFFLLLIYDWKAVRLPWQRRFSPPDTIDMIIPVHNEASRILSHLHSLQTAVNRINRDQIGFRILIVDGESSDNTCDLLADEAVELLQAPRGRGTQLAAGYAASTADLIILLHADCLMHPDALRRLLQVLQAKPSVGWGVLGHGYNVKTPALRIIDWLNQIRFHAVGIAFGDQGIFFRREVLAGRGGIPDILLMEDVELSLRLADVPRISLKKNLIASARSWERSNALFRAARIMGMVFAYLLCRRLGGDIKRLSVRLYSFYYGVPNQSK